MEQCSVISSHCWGVGLGSCDQLDKSRRGCFDGVQTAEPIWHSLPCILEGLSRQCLGSILDIVSVSVPSIGPKDVGC